MAAVGTSKVDEYILRYSESRSLREIAAMLGGVVSVEALAARSDALFDTRNWLTDAQREKRIVLLLEETLNEIADAFQDKDMLKIKLSYIKEISVRFDKRKAALSADLDVLYGNQGRIMARVYDIAISYLKGAILNAPDGEVTSETWDRLQVEAIGHAQRELAKYQVEE